jgi:hypothetical protein
MMYASLSRGRRWLKLLVVSLLAGGSLAAHAIDTYDPVSGILTIPLVIVGNTAYLNVQVFVPINNVLSPGTVNDPNANLNAPDQYSTATGELTIGAVRVGNNLYTNAVVAAALSDVRAVGAVMSTPVAPWMALFDPLAPATVGTFYAANLVAAVAPASRYTFGIDTLANGVLPTGMTIDLNGVLSGTPFATGRTDINGHQIANTYTFGVCATDTISRATTFPCPQTSITVNPAPVTLTVAKAGTGTGTVVSSPAGISCGAFCGGAAPSGTSGTLTAVPDSGSTFAGWSGACTNATGACLLTLFANASVTATFNIDQSQVKSDAVTPSAVQLGKAGSCTGGVLSTTFHVAAPTGITWTAAADPNTPPLGDQPLGVAPASGSGSGDVVVTVTVPPQLPSSSYSSCSLQYFLDTFSNMYVSFSDGTVIGVTVYWTFVGTT